MTVTAFVDSNVLIYAALARPGEREKRDRAVRLIAEVEFGLSAQVLAEFYANVTKPVGRALPFQIAIQWLERLEVQPCVSVDAAIVKRGAAISGRYQISYWDGAIIAAAEALGASTLYSEDMNHGQAYGTVNVVNPFR